MNKIKKFIQTHKHFYSLIIFFPLMIWFSYCEKTIVPKYIMHTRFDDKIPFIKEFVVFYILWYFYIAFGLFYNMVTSKKDYYKLYVFVFGSMVLCYILYGLYPNAQNLRPQITKKDIFSIIIAFIYKIDTPTNVCPSLHVIDSIAVDASLRNSKQFNNNKGNCLLSFIIMLLISVSTLFIKQHSIIDIYYGIIVAILFYIPLYSIPNIIKYKSTCNTYNLKGLVKAGFYKI